MICGIYKITSPSGKIYIGQSINIEKRFKQYKTKHLGKQIRLSHSILKYGIENHVFEIFEECEVNLLNERERYWQEYYNVIGKNGLNCILVSTKDKKAIPSIESIEKNRKTHQEKYKNGESVLCKLNEISKNLKIEKQNLKKKLKSKKIFKEHTKKLISEKAKERLNIFHPNAKQVINIETLEIFKDVKTANNSIINLNKSRRELNRILSLETYNPSKLMFLENYNDLEKRKQSILKMNKKYSNKAVINIKTKEIFNTVKEAAKSINMDKGSLSNRLRNVTPNYTNFIFLSIYK